VRFAKLLSIVLAAVFVAGCATVVTLRQPLAQMSVGNLQFRGIEATSTLTSVTPENIARLKMSVAERVSKLPKGDVPVKIEVVVTEFDIQSGATRLVAGAFSGSNKMTVSVKVIDPVGKTIADFDVQRSGNPGGYGFFYSQTDATINAVADGIADVLSVKSGARRDL